MPINADNNNNNDNNKDEQQQSGPQALAGSGQANTAPSASGRVANFSSGQQPNNIGSGRFTNLQKYINANQGSGERLGSRIGSNFDRNVNQQNKDINQQNNKISENVAAGRNLIDNEGQGFQQQLGDIGNQLNSFQNMENRGNFDAGAQAAQNFAKQPNFNQFQNIQAGTAIDNDMLTNAQNQAAQAGNKLQSYTGDQLNKIKTEQGRYNLLQDSFNKNKNPYSAGSARLDNLFLQAAPSTISSLTNKMNQGNIGAQSLVQNITNQGNNLNTLLNDESTLVNNLNTQAQKNQDIFNQKLGDQKNIDFIQDLRNKKYDEYLKQLKSGNISDEVSKEFGLNQLDTYRPVDSSLMTAQRMPNLDAARQIRSYNTNLNDAASWLKKGGEAKSFQDIATEDDYNAYKALANIAKRDTGKLAGASTLDKAVSAQNNLEGRSLADVISGQDQAFKDNFAGKNFSSVGAGFTAADDRGNSVLSEIANLPLIPNTMTALPVIGANFLNNFTGTNGNSMQSSTGATPQAQTPNLDNIYQGDAGQNYQDFYNRINSANASMGSRGGVGTAAATVNFDDFFNSGNLDKGQIQSGNIQNQGIGTSAGNSRQAVANARNQAVDRLVGGLNQAINTYGAKNQININQDSSNNEILNRARRFSRLV